MTGLARPLLVYSNQGGGSIPHGRTQEYIELDQIGGSRSSPSPSILKTIRSFSLLRKKSSLRDIPDEAQNDTAESRYEWVRGVVLSALGSSVIATLNIILAITAIALSYSKFGGSSAGSRTLYVGNCSQSKTWATGLHLLINILSTLLLAASNYCMQCLSAPSRADVDRAHAKRRWLGIGTAGLRNLWYVNRRRKALWFILLITSLPIHLMYNSVVFSKLTTYAYPVYLASSNLDFRNHAIDSLVDKHTAHCFKSWTNQAISEFGRDLADDSKFEVLSKKECVDKYAVNYVTDRRAVVVIVNGNLTASEDHTIFSGGLGDAGLSYRWICAGSRRLLSPYSRICTKEKMMGNLDTWSVFGEPLNIIYWRMNISTTKGAEQLDLSNVVDHTDPLPYYASESKSFREDLQTLKNFTEQTYPSELDMRQFLNNETNWNNGSWASSVTFTHSERCRSRPNEYRTTPINQVAIRYSVDGCLSERVDEKCELVFNLPISLVVIACNIVKIVCMFLTAKEDRDDVLLKIGDAVASFLKRPDPTTTGQCLISKRAICKGSISREYSSRDKPIASGAPLMQRLGYSRVSSLIRGQRGSHSNPEERGSSTEFIVGHSRWYQAAGSLRWLIVIFLMGAGLAVVAGLLELGVSSLSAQTLPNDIAALWRLGFGKTDRNTFINVYPGSTIATVLLVNSPQLYLSVVYFAYNNLLTAMVLPVEYSNYGVRRKPLRVSWPRGEQRSSYYLSLPYAYSVPLIMVSALLHWLLSQSMFYVRIDVVGLTRNIDDVISTCGYSPIALIFTIIVGSVMAVVLVGLGMRRYKSPIPLAGDCSMAISAACHPPDEDKDAALKPIMWGEVVIGEPSRKSSADSENPFAGPSSPEELTTYDGGHDFMGTTEYGHCCFTSMEVVSPSPRKMYS